MKGLVVGTFNKERKPSSWMGLLGRPEGYEIFAKHRYSSNSLAYSELCGRGVGLCLNVELQASHKQCSQNNPAGSFGFFTREQIETKTVQ